MHTRIPILFFTSPSPLPIQPQVPYVHSLVQMLWYYLEYTYERV